MTPAPGRMFVVGRVLDPQGKPVPGATVMVQARVRRSEMPSVSKDRVRLVIGHADADGSGQFRLDSPRTSSSRNDEFMAVALAPGYGVGWAELDPDADQPDAEIRLQPEQVIQGRLFDLQGRPAQGVTVSVSAIRRILIRTREHGLARRRFEGPSYWWARVNDLPAWPKPATTDADGRFTLHGVGRGLQTSLSIIDSRFATQMIDVETDNSPDAKPVTMALRPAQIITGRVTYADTGKPVPHALLVVTAYGGRSAGTGWPHVQTDADGRFRVESLAGRRVPRPGPSSRRAALPRRLQEIRVAQGCDRAFPRPVPAPRHADPRQGHRGRLPPSRRGCAGGLLAHREADGPATGAVNRRRWPMDRSSSPAHPDRVIWPSRAPAQDYVLQEIGNREFFEGQPGGLRLYSHAFIACDPKPGGTSPGSERHSPPGRHRDRPHRRAGRSAGSGYLDHQPNCPRTQSRGMARLAG